MSAHRSPLDEFKNILLGNMKQSNVRGTSQEALKTTHNASIIKKGRERKKTFAYKKFADFSCSLKSRDEKGAD